jgi:hypothetical protein
MVADLSQCRKKRMSINNCSLAETCCINANALHRIIITVMKIQFIDIGDTQHQSICLLNKQFICAKGDCRFICLLLAYINCDIWSMIWNGVCVCVRVCVRVCAKTRQRNKSAVSTDASKSVLLLPAARQTYSTRNTLMILASKVRIRCQGLKVR